MFILENAFLMFIIFVVVLVFIIAPAIGWIMCGIVDSYNGNDKGYKRNAVVGFAFMFMIGLITLVIRMILAFTGVIPVPF